MPTVTHGLKSIKYGAIATDGSTATTFTPKGLTLSDTFKIDTPDNEETDFRSEENDEVEETIVVKGNTQFRYSIMNADAELSAFFLGGNATAGVWSSPDSAENKEQSVEIETKTGVVITVNRAKISAKRSGELSKKGLATIDVRLKVLRPKKAGVPAETWADPS